MNVTDNLKLAESLWGTKDSNKRKEASEIFKQCFLENPKLIFQKLELENPGEEEIESYRSRIQFRLKNWYQPNSEPIIPLAKISNKFFAKELIAKKYPQNVPKTYYYGDNVASFDFSQLQGAPVVIKPDNMANSDGIIILKNNLDLMTGNVVPIDKIQDYIDSTIRSNKFYNSRYYNIKITKIIVEEYIEKNNSKNIVGNTTPNVQFFCMGGKAWITIVRVTMNHLSMFNRNLNEIKHIKLSRSQMQSNYNPIGEKCFEIFSKNEVIEAMEFAEHISKMLGISARIDCYISDRGPTLGEVTTCSANGLTPSLLSDRIFAQLMEIFPDDPWSISKEYDFSNWN